MDLIFYGIFLPLMVHSFVIVDPDPFAKKTSLDSAETDIQSRSDDSLDNDLSLSPSDLLFDDGAEDQILMDQSSAESAPLEDNYAIVNGILCRKCPPGTGLVSMCNATHQTVCEPCVVGANYSENKAHFRPCAPCSQCGSGMFIDIRCTVESDTFCDWCHGIKDKNYLRKLLTQNGDFLDKCDVIAAVNKLSSTSEESSMENTKLRNADLVKSQAPTTPSQKRAADPLAIDELIIEDDIDHLEQEIKQDDDLIKRLEIELIVDGTGKESEPQSMELSNFRRSSNVSVDTVLIDGNWLPKSDYGQNDRDSQEIVFKPSVHSYPYNDLIHASPLHNGSTIKTQFLIALLICIGCILCLISIVKRCCGSKKVESTSWLSLTDEDNRIIQECAKKMANCERHANKSNRICRYNPFDNEDDVQVTNDSDVAISITENPLITYLEHDKTSPDPQKNESQIVNV